MVSELGQKMEEVAAVHLPVMEEKMEVENGTMSRELVEGEGRTNRSGMAERKGEKGQVFLRFLCMLASGIALSFMLTATEASTISIYGFSIPISSKWSLSDSFEYLAGVSAAVVAHSLLQLVLGTLRLLRKSPLIPSRNHAWIIFAGDQAFAYAMMSAGSAASGVTNLNRTGIRHTELPKFCKSLQSFCDHVAISVAFSFFSCFLLAVSAVHGVIWLSRN